MVLGPPRQRPRRLPASPSGGSRASGAAATRFKDSKEHRYWSVVENCRHRDGRVVQRQVPHLGEINDSQRASWCRAVEVVREGSGTEPMALAYETAALSGCRLPPG